MEQEKEIIKKIVEEQIKKGNIEKEFKLTPDNLFIMQLSFIAGRNFELDLQMEESS